MPRILLAVMLATCATIAGAANFDAIKQKAESGDVRAMFAVALCYDRGRDAPLDKAEAARWYRQAAEGGLALAQNSLGSMYQAGEGVEKDYAQARLWYQKAADQGDGEATNNLAYLHDEGFGMPENDAKAVELYTLAAERGFLPAMLNLGLMYGRGEGVPKDPVEAYKWLDLARLYSQTSDDRQLKWRSRGALDQLSKTMSRAEIEAAENRAKEWDVARRKKP